MTIDIEESPLYGVLSSPNDDVVRLVYADWLDENAGATTCQKCYTDIVVMEFDQKSSIYLPTEDALAYFPDSSDECVICMGAGTVPDSRVERAEFIRVQCRIHEIEQGEKYNIAASSEWTGQLIKIDLEEWDKLKQRESSLLWKYHTAWFTPPENMQSNFNIRITPEFANEPSYVIRSGFIERVQMTLEQFMGRVCERCGGQGWSSVPVDRYYTKFQQLGCSDCGGAGVTQMGTGRIGGCAADLFSRHPITSVRIIDRVPQQYPRDYHGSVGGIWGWTKERQETQYHIPEPVYDLLEGYKSNGLWKDYSSHDKSEYALSNAFVNYGRSLVGHHYADSEKRLGLPPLKFAV